MMLQNEKIRHRSKCVYKVVDLFQDCKISILSQTCPCCYKLYFADKCPMLNNDSVRLNKINSIHEVKSKRSNCPVQEIDR